MSTAWPSAPTACPAAMTWPRPVPLVGDPTSAADRAAAPAGWAFDDATIAAVDAVIGARRDVRRYRPDAVPGGVLRRVLAAGHQAPSVGQSQPWRFIVVQEQAARDRAALLADRERLRQADLLTADRIYLGNSVRGLVRAELLDPVRRDDSEHALDQAAAGH